MDLKAILAANKSKTERATLTRKPVGIADQDRPYSIDEKQQVFNNAEPPSLFNDTPPLPIYDETIQSLETIGKPAIVTQTANMLATKAEQTKPDAHATQTTHKVDTNLTQSRHKVDTNIAHIPDTKLTQTTHKKILLDKNLTQTTHKPNTKLNTTKTQSRHKLHTNLTQSRHISTLIGVQRMILLFIFEECKKARSHITEPLSITHIANGLEIAVGSIKTSVSRLCAKEFVKIHSFKNGRGGWSTYEIPDDVYKELLQMETQHKLHTNLTQSRYKVDTKPNTELNTMDSSSSSLKDLRTTTTELSDEWNFDITPYARFGFTTTQIKQLASLGTISAIDVEQSLIEFSYDLENNSLPPIKTGKINFLMGLLRKGQAYISEGFKNEQEAMILEMSNRAEAKRKNLLEAKFGVWEAGLNVEEVSEILSVRLMSSYKSHGISNAEVRECMFNYYLQNVKE